MTVTITSDSIQISDDGLGLTEDVIRNSWVVVATPNKKVNPTVEREGSEMAGDKGYVQILKYPLLPLFSTFHPPHYLNKECG